MFRIKPIDLISIHYIKKEYQNILYVIEVKRPFPDSDYLDTTENNNLYWLTYNSNFTCFIDILKELYLNNTPLLIRSELLELLSFLEQSDICMFDLQDSIYNDYKEFQINRNNSIFNSIYKISTIGIGEIPPAHFNTITRKFYRIPEKILVNVYINESNDNVLRVLSELFKYEINMNLYDNIDNLGGIDTIYKKSFNDDEYDRSEISVAPAIC